MPTSLAILLLAALPLFFRLGSFPLYPAQWELQSLRVGLTHFRDPASSFSAAQWRWSSVCNPYGTQAAPHALLIEGGLHLAGPSWLGVRLLPAILAWLALVALFFTVRHAHSTRRAAILVLLLASAPLYLVFARSTMNVGVLFSNALLAGCALYWSVRKKAPAWWSAGAALVIAALPFSYPAGRPLPFVAIAVLLACPQFRRRRRGLWFAGGMLIGLLPMFGDWPREMLTYFSARGESLIGQRDATVSLLAGQLLNNFRELARELVGYYATRQHALLENTSRSEIALYPFALVPVFLLGLGMAAHSVWRGEGWKEGWILAALVAAALAPLGASTGGVNALRDVLLALPIYAAIALAFDRSFEQFPRRLMTSALALMLAGTVSWQTIDYFCHPHERARVHLTRQIAPVLLEALAKKPPARLRSSVCKSDDCNDALRLYGGRSLLVAERAGRVELLRADERAPASRADFLFELRSPRPGENPLWTGEALEGPLTLSRSE